MSPLTSDALISYASFGLPHGLKTPPRVIARHWQTVRQLKLVREDLPHLTLRATDGDGKTYFVEILTWRDGSIPDAAPPAVLAIWQELHALVEGQPGHPGLEITNVTMVDPRAQ
jgi:hypothetical protein